MTCQSVLFIFSFFSRNIFLCSKRLRSYENLSQCIRGVSLNVSAGALSILTFIKKKKKKFAKVKLASTKTFSSSTFPKINNAVSGLKMRTVSRFRFYSSMKTEKVVSRIISPVKQFDELLHVNDYFRI